MDHFAQQVQETEKLLNNPEAEWMDKSEAITNLANTVESLGQSVSHKDALRLLMSLSVGLSIQLGSTRSKLVRNTCECLLRIINVMGQDFKDMANALLPQIVSTAKSTSVAMRQPGSKLLHEMSKVVRYDLALMREIYEENSHAKGRLLVLEQLRLVFVYWRDEEVLQYESDVCKIIQRGLEDQNESVRKTARETLADFSVKWNERAIEFVDLLSAQSKGLLVHDHRESPIAKAILEKHPDIIHNLDSFSRSKSAFSQSRVGSRESPLLRRGQKVEIYASETTTLKQLENPKSLSPDVMNAEGSMETHTTDPNLRYPFDNSNVSSGSELDQHDQSPEAFDGSQMHEYSLAHSASNSVQMSTLKYMDALNSSSCSSSQSRSSSASSTHDEEAESITPSDLTLKRFHKQSPNFQSISSQNEKPSKVSTTSEEHLSLLPRPRSSTLKTSRCSSPSSPMLEVKDDEETIESSLGAYEELVNKQPPGLKAISTKLSSDNVIMRSRYRRLDQENELHQMPSSKSSTLKSSTLNSPPLDQLQQAKTEHALTDRAFENEMSSMLEQSNAGSALSNEDDVMNYFYDGSVHTDFIHEKIRDQQSEYHDNLAEKLPDPLNFSAVSGCTVPDEGHLNEGCVKDSDLVQGLDNLMPTLHDNVLPARHRHYIKQSCPEEEADEQHKELDTMNYPSDSLTALMNVCENIKSLRKVTRNVEMGFGFGETCKKEHVEIAMHHTLIASTANEVEKSPHAMCNVQSPDKPGIKDLSYLECSKQGDQNILAPPIDGSYGQKDSYEEQSFLDTSMPAFRPISSSNDRAKTNDDAFVITQAQQPKHIPVSERATRISENESHFVDDLHVAENTISRTESKGSSHETFQNQNSNITHGDKACRFDAAEKLFALKEPVYVHDRYDNTQLPHESYVTPKIPERLPKELYSTRSTSRYAAPTSMGAKLSCALRKNAAIKNTSSSAETVIADNAGEEEISNQADEITPLLHLSVSGDESEPTELKHADATPLNLTPPYNTPGSDNSAASKQSNFCSKSLAVIFSAIFCMAGLLYAAKKVNESREYHLNLKSRIDKFEASIAESHSKVLQLEGDFTVWTEYVRNLAEEEEANALTQLQALHTEVQRWQQDMHDDLEKFRQALTLDFIDTAFANLDVNDAKKRED
ncbi:CLASP N-terminal domain [Plasmopara halstedii]|uniref:CLASP N-terminal domain n=1 Tax=Plasmopara halstedii TaxID=4781 RepID=A0A0P1A713_PLAHL|nr:CLASP N-terminal domain [Plasmopara halstedii]CEG36410.1 CLASP N-terminal domain [Plasmopara halstedii]|eukprot:XP_024572779.1 CLASP N-terminal domain [Plasmopara halstedii]